MYVTKSGLIINYYNVITITHDIIMVVIMAPKQQWIVERPRWSTGRISQYYSIQFRCLDAFYHMNGTRQQAGSASDGPISLHGDTESRGPVTRQQAGNASDAPI